MNSLESIERSISKTREELHRLRVENKRACLNNCSTRERTTKHLAVMSRRIKTTRGDQMSKQSSLVPYQRVIRSVMEDRPQYVQTLEAKVCQALHLMAIGNDQFVRFENDCDKHLSQLKSKSIGITDEATTLSLTMMNEISKLDDSNHDLRTAYLKVLQVQCATLRWLDSQVKTFSYDDKKLIERCNNNNTTTDMMPLKEDSPSNSINEEVDSLNMSLNDDETTSKKLSPLASPVSVLHRTYLDNNSWPLECEITSSSESSSPHQ